MKIARRKIGSLIVAALALAAPAIASAETYLGASYAEFSTDASNFSDDRSNGYRLFLGATASGVFGWEVGYGRVDEFRGTQLGKVDVTAGDASLLVGLPIGPVKAFGRLGALYASVSTANGGNDNDWTYEYGVGLDVNLGKTFGLRFEWTRFPIKTKNIDADIDIAAAGFMVRF